MEDIVLLACLVLIPKWYESSWIYIYLLGLCSLTYILNLEVI